jgi:YggT family protein
VSLAALRYAVFAAFLVSVLVAAGSWAVRTRRVHPFSAGGRTLRQITDPLIGPVERWLVRRGGNPQAAPWWLVGIALVGGIVTVTGIEWLAVQASRVAASGRGGVRGLARLVVYYAGQILLIAIIVRVIASWFGVFRYHPWMRPVYAVTDWVIEPLRKIVPPIGMIDITPIVAWFAIQLLLSGIMRVL